MKIQGLLNKYGFIIFFILGFINLWPYLPSITWIPETLACVFLLTWILVHSLSNEQKVLTLDNFSCVFLALAALGPINLLLRVTPYQYWDLSWTLFFLLAAFFRIFIISSASEASLDLLRKNLLQAIFMIGLIQLIFSLFHTFGFWDSYVSWSQNLSLWIPHLPKTDFVSGSMYQKNHLSTLLILFSITTCYLLSVQKIQDKFAWSALSLTAFYLSETASRLVIIQLLAIFILILIRHKWIASSKKILQNFSIFLIISLSFQVASSLTSTRQDQSAIQRLQNSTASDYRWSLWSQSWNLIKEHPFIGNGLGKFAEIRTQIQSFIPLQNENLNSEMYHHSHMWALQLLIEQGLIIGGALIFLLLYTMWTSFKHSQKNDLTWILWLCAWTVFIHSFTEYPLWYLSFFMLFIFCISFCIQSKKLWSLPFPLRPAVQILIMALIVFSSTSLYQYVGLMGAYYEKDRSLIRSLPGDGNPLLQPVVDFYKFSMMTELNETDLHDKIRLCEKVRSARPVEYVFFKCSVFYAFSGDISLALEQLQSAYHMYPASAQKMYQWLSSIPMEKDPRLQVLKFRLEQMIVTGN